MPKILNLIGSKFGRLLVIQRQGAKWLCLCDCGQSTSVISASLNNGNTKSCGCAAREKSSERMSKLRDSLPALKPGDDLSRERLRELLDYNPFDGRLRWLRTVNPRANAGDIAGGNSLSNGYRIIGIGGRTYRQHRVIWLLVTGSWPDGEIDHINGNKSDNRIENLRVVTRTVNAQNERMARRSSSAGVLGASRNRGRFRSEIRVGGKRITLGYFASAEEAGAAYLAAKRTLHEGCTI